MYLCRALALLALVLAPPALGMQCPEECECDDGEELLYRCTVDNSTIEITGQLNRYVNIDCEGAVLPCSLPSVGLGRNASLPSLSLRSCLVADVRCVLAALAVTDVTTLMFMDARATVDGIQWTGLGTTSLTVYTAVPQNVPLPALTSLPLASFRLNGGHVTLTPDMFLHAGPLKYLELSSDGIQYIPAGSFRGLDTLEQLNLFGNNMSVVGPGALEGLPSLKQLSLSTSDVRRLEEGVFSSTPRLRTFTMLRALMTHLGDVFQHLQELEKVTISNDLPLSLPVVSSPSLLVLSLAWCHLSSPPSLLTPRLTNLTLEHNQLTLMPKVDHLKQLKELKLDYNLLETLTDDMFSGLKHLEYVSITQNKLHTISKNAFRGTSSLRYLFLSHNNLTLQEEQGQASYVNIYRQSPFNLINELVTLDLSDNKISQIFEDWCNVLLHLKRLDLSWNRFNKITSQDVQFLGLGTVVDVRHNNISTINLGDTLSIEGLEPSGAPRGTLLIANNPLLCDCEMYGVVRRLHGATPVVPELTPNVTDVRCAAPDSLRGTLLTDINPIDLSCELPTCPANCTCVYRPAGETADYHCYSLPTSISIRELGINKMWLKLHTAPASFEVLPEYVTKLNLSGLALTNVPSGTPWSELEEVDLRDNLLKVIPYELLQYNVTLYLAGNPIECCDVNILQGVVDVNDLRCNVCENRAAIIAAGSVLILVIAAVLLGTIVAVRWRREAKVWLAAKGWFAKEEELGTEPYDAFVSFAHGDEEWVRYKLIPALEQEWRICVHYRDWAVGEMIPAQIARSVSGARRTLAVVSKYFIQSQWAKLEFRAAAQRALAERRPRLLVLLLDDSLSSDTSIDPELKAYLATSTYLSGSDPNFWAKLRRAMPPPRQDPSPLPLPSGPLNVALTPDGKLVNINEKLRK